MNEVQPTSVLIAGGGVAGIETLLALKQLAGDRVAVTVVAPTAEFVYKPLAVLTPFSPDAVTQFDLASLVDEAGGTFLQRRVVRIDTEHHRAELEDGSSLEFDVAAICVGAQPRIVLAHAKTLRTSGDPIDIDALLRQAAEHSSRRMVLALPPTGSWPLPVYELALMAQQRAQAISLDVEFTIVTPESKPLSVFGPQASGAIESLLAARHVDVRTNAHVHEGQDGVLILEAGHVRLEAGAVLALPELHGPAVAGLPADERGFIPIDAHARVTGTTDIYAAGDGTNFPIKHGGLGAQQADAAAQHIAARAGVEIEPQPFHPVIRGKLITMDESLNLEADVGGDDREGRASFDSLWWPPQKIAGKYLAAMLAGAEPREIGPPPLHGIEVEVALDREWHRQPLTLDSLDPN